MKGITEKGIEEKSGKYHPWIMIRMNGDDKCFILDGEKDAAKAEKTLKEFETALYYIWWMK